MLSDKAIQALRPDPDRPGTKHHDRDGLYLWVARSGSKTWRKDYRWQGAPSPSALTRPCGPPLQRRHPSRD